MIKKKSIFFKTVCFISIFQKYKDFLIIIWQIYSHNERYCYNTSTIVEWWMDSLSSLDGSEGNISAGAKES